MQDYNLEIFQHCSTYHKFGYNAELIMHFWTPVFRYINVGVCVDNGYFNDPHLAESDGTLRPGETAHRFKYSIV